jgi:hypothetical protein
VRGSEQTLDERIDGVRAGQHDPIEHRDTLTDPVERPEVLGRHDANHRSFDGFGSHRLELVDELCGLFTWPSDEDPLAKQRPYIEPPQMLAKPGDAADDQHRRRAIGQRLRQFCDVVERANECLLCRKRSRVDDGRGVVRRPSVRQQRGDDLLEPLWPRVAHDRAVEFCQAAPVHVSPRLSVVFVPSDKAKGVAAARVGDRNAGVRGRSDSDWNARYHLEAQTLLVKEECLRTAAVEDKRIAPLETRHSFSFACLFSEEVADGFLIERAWRSQPHIQLLRVWSGVPQQPRMDEMVVEHDICRLQVTQATRCDEAWISWAGSNQINNAGHEMVGRWSLVVGR